MVSLKIKGQYFIDETNIEIFVDDKVKNNITKREEQKLCVLYGKNGSGKTTISNAFASLGETIGEKFDYVQPLNFDNKETISLDYKIYVFNETFVAENISLKEDDALNAILLFGKAAELDGKIEKINETIKKEEENISKVDIEKYERQKDPNNLNNSFSLIKENLKTNWSFRDQKIKGTSKRTSVGDDFVKALCDTVLPDETKTKLEGAFNNLLSDITKAKDSLIVDDFNLSFPIVNFKQINELLSKSYDKAEMTDFAQNVLQSIQKRSSKYLDDTIEVLTSDDICPLCFQEINDKHKQNTLDLIGKLFDKRINEAKNQLRSLKIAELSKPNLEVYNGIIDGKIIFDIYNVVDKCNEFIKTINDSIEIKIGSIYDPCDKINLDIESFRELFDGKITALKNEINKHNTAIKNRLANMSSAQEINLKIARIEASTLISNYKKLLKNYENDTKLVEESKTNITKAKTELLDLNAERKNSKIALNEINKYLAFIFGTKNRLFLQATDDGLKYYILSKNKKIKAKKLSTGERNIIALVYFYETLKSNCQQNEYFKDKAIYVIDDPISSFDFENKLGIFSFLKEIINEMHNGNENSKIAIFTHELEAASFLNRIISDLKMEDISCFKELSNKVTKKLNPTKFSTYGNLLLTLFEYIEDDNFDLDCYIGNTCRRLLEAYSTFNYKQTIDKFLAQKEYAAKIEVKELKEYFSSKIDRILYNEGSHSETISRCIPGDWNLDLFSHDDKIQAAKDAIVFLYSLDKKHIEMYLGSQNLNIVKKWSGDIIENMKV